MCNSISGSNGGDSAIPGVDGGESGIPGVDGGDSGNENVFTIDVLERPKMTFSRANGVALQSTNASVQIKSTRGGRPRDLLNILIDVAVSSGCFQCDLLGRTDPLIEMQGPI